MKRLAVALAALCLSGCTVQQVALALHLNRPVAGQQVACAQWLGATRLAGFSEGEIPNLHRIMYRESRCDPGAYQVSRNRDHLPDRCLLQIHATWDAQLVVLGIIRFPDDLFNPQVCLRAARYVLISQGWSAWATR